MKTKFEKLLIPCLILLLNSMAEAQINASLVASRTSGVAPLAVHFDATETVADSTNRPLHELDYSWNFGDDPNVTFEVTGRSKNTAIGFVAGHLFENPGSYLVTLTVTDKNGNQQVKTKQIDVLNPDDFFSDTTVCISTDSISNSDGCPADALKLQNQASNNIENLIEDQVEAGKRRILLEAGTSWSTNDAEKISLRENSGYLGMFGNGDRPIIDCNSTNACLSASGNDWRIKDLVIDASGSGDYVMTGPAEAQQTLVQNCRLISGGGTAFSFYSNASSVSRPEQIALVENKIEKLNNNSAGRLFTMYGRRFMVLGNEASTSADAHVIRSGLFSRSTFNNNKIVAREHDKTTMKLHAPNFSITNEYSEKFIVVHNIFDTDNAGPGGGIIVAPQNDDSDERHRNIIFDGNHMTAGIDTSTFIKSSGENVTIRNNIFDYANETIGKAVNVTRRDDNSQEPYPKNVHVYNNTVYGSSSGELKAFNVEEGSQDTIIRNNLVYFPNSSDARLIEADDGINSQIDHNLAYFPSDTGSCVSPTGGSACLNPQFVDAAAGDFELLPNSSAIDAGLDLAGIVNRDFNGNERPVDVPNTGDSLWDIGALEFGAVGSSDNGVSLSVNDSSPQAGETLTLTLSGGDANKIFDLQILVGSNFITFHSGRLSSAGTGSFSLVLSGNVPSGTYSVRARTIKELESGNKVLVETASQLLSFN